MVFPLQLGYLHQEIGCLGWGFLFAFDLILVGSPVLLQLLDLAIGYFMSRLRKIKEQPQQLTHISALHRCQLWINLRVQEIVIQDRLQLSDGVAAAP